jgi:beta-lactamase regulating signal transducer with metallopeptidase domain
VDAVLNWLWQGSLVSLAAAALVRILDRSRAQCRYVVCWAALVVVLVLPLIAPSAGAVLPPASSSGVATESAAIVSVPSVWWTSDVVLLALWSAWAALYGIRLTTAIRALRRAQAGSRPFPEALAPRLRCWSRLCGQGRQARLVISDRVRAAAVLGCGSPSIAVAPALLEHLDADELDRIVIHEWAHVQRRDDIANAVQLLARLIAGWHPAVWWIDRRLHMERELACDEMTVDLTGSPKSYAASLVKLADMPAAISDLPVPAALSTSGLRTRIARLVSGRPAASPLWSRAIAIVSVTLLFGLSSAISGFELVAIGVVAVGTAPPSARAADIQQPAIQFVERAVTGAAAFPVPRSARPRRGVLTRVDSQPVTLPAAPMEFADLVTESHASETDGVAQLESARIESVGALGPPPRVEPSAGETKTSNPWDRAAAAGVAVGRASKDAGIATAGFFTRAATRIADSF